MGDLETLEAVAAFSFLAHDIEDGINKFSTLGVVALGPVVSGASLSENEVVGSEKLTERSSTDGVHGAGLKIHKDCAGYVTSASGLVEVNVDTFELEVGVAVVGTSWVNAVLVGNNFPELGTDLVTALAALDVNDFSHWIF